MFFYNFWSWMRWQNLFNINVSCDSFISKNVFLLLEGRDTYVSVYPPRTRNICILYGGTHLRQKSFSGIMHHKLRLYLQSLLHCLLMLQILLFFYFECHELFSLEIVQFSLVDWYLVACFVSINNRNVRLYRLVGSELWLCPLTGLFPNGAVWWRFVRKIPF